MKRFLITIILILSVVSVFSQEPAPQSDTLRKDALNVFMSSSSFIRTEITFVNYVRDIKVADVYIISTYEETGSGGESVKYFIVGQNKYAGMADTIVVNMRPDETEDGYRKMQVAALKMGLMRYVLKTPLSQYFDIRFTKPVKETITTDRWNSWVFSPRLSGSLNAQRRYKSYSLYGDFTANRVTEKARLMTDVYFNWNEQRYELNDSTIQKSFTRSQNGYLLYVLSINNHWSAGISSSIGTSSYNGYDLTFNIAPAIEYDIFPYSESTRRQLRIQYRAGYQYNDYTEITIYDKLTQHLGYHSLNASLDVVQKWGSADFSLTWKNYFYDWSKNNFAGNLYLSLRIVKGLSLSFQGQASIINDQIGLPKGGISDTDILLRNKMTETKFSYYAYFGVSYTFGSIYNNVVNPRFGY